MLAQSSDRWKTKLIGFLEKEIELTNLVPDVLDHSELLPNSSCAKTRSLLSGELDAV
jgi:hypothetical protein